MYIDLTHTFNAQMPVFPGDAVPELVQTTTIEQDGIVHFDLKTGMHVGTHMDAPLHMLKQGKFLSDYPAAKFFGRGVLLDARGKKSAGAELLPGIKIQKGDIVLVMFGWSSEFGQEEYYYNYPEITPDLARGLAESGASIVGMDTPSPDRAPYEAHKILFKHDVLIIENLTNLQKLANVKNFEIIALPMQLQAEAAPCRVIAKC